MTDDRTSDEIFADLLDRHGGDLARWPAAARTEAAAVLAVSAKARHALALMREAEAALAEPGPETGALGAMAARAMRAHQIRTRMTHLAKAGWSAAAAAVLLCGLFVGASGDHADDDPSVALSRTMAATEIIDVD